MRKMKLKYVLFSSLFLTAGFVACTNDEFAEVSNQVNTEKAISLGEGFSIGGEYGLGAETRSMFDKVDGRLLPVWEEDDVIGASWYHMVTGINNEGQVTNASNIGSSLGSYYSNHPFTLTKGAGTSYANFETVTNAFAGAYVVYFPYDDLRTQYYEAIPVKVNFPQVADCTSGNELNTVNENMFAYGAAAFVPGGHQSSTFHLVQAPVLYQMQFAADKLAFVGLLPDWTIDKIIVEAYNAKGQSLLTTTGEVTPNTTTPLTEEIYNKYLNDPEANPLPAPVYTSTADGRVDHFTINVKNSSEAYEITELDKLTGSFYFSALPFINGEEATKVVVKIVTEPKEGDSGLVFARTYQKGASAYDNQMLAEFNKAQSNQMIVDGESKNVIVNVNVRLNTQVTDETIYTEEQFMNRWEAAIESTTPQTLIIGEDLDLTGVTLTCNNKDADVTVEGHAITVDGINLESGAVNFENEVTVAGDVTITGDVDLTATLASVNNMDIAGDANLTVSKFASLYVASSGIVELNGPADANNCGSIFVRRNGQLTLNGVAINDLTNTGGTVKIGANTVITKDKTFTNEGTLAVSEDLRVNGTFINKGTMTFTTGKKIINNNVFTNQGTVSGTAKLENAEDAIANINAATNMAIENNGTINVEMPEVTTALTCGASSTNEGIINVKKGTLNVNTLSQTTNDDARIYVEKDGRITNYKDANFGSSWIILNDKDAKVTGSDYNRVAYSVKNSEDFATAAAKPANKGVVFIDGPIEITSATTWNTCNMYINANVTLKADFTIGNHCYFGGDVTVSSGDNAAHSFTLNSYNQNEVYKGAKLTINKNVTLKGNIIAHNNLFNNGGNISATVDNKN